MNSSRSWALRIVAALAAAAIYGAWRRIDLELGWGMASSFLRGAVVLGGLAWVWSATMARSKAPVLSPADFRPCRFCAEPIRTAARLCRFCNRDVPPAVSAAEAAAGGVPDTAAVNPAGGRVGAVAPIAVAVGGIALVGTVVAAVLIARMSAPLPQAAPAKDQEAVARAVEGGALSARSDEPTVAHSRSKDCPSARPIKPRSGAFDWEHPRKHPDHPGVTYYRSNVTGYWIPVDDIDLPIDVECGRGDQ